MSTMSFDRAGLLLALVVMSLVVGNSALAQASDTSQTSQSVSQTGLLPVYGADVSLDASWVDSTKFPGDQTAFPNSGTSAAFQKLWDALAPCGLNCVRFKVDVRDPKSAAIRTANLCVWAQGKSAYLLPVLTGSDPGKAPDAAFAKNVADYVKQLNKELSPSNAQAYKQILAFQIESCMNHPGLHGVLTPDAAAKAVTEAAASLRAAEQESMAGASTEVSPIMADASFDCELIGAKSMAGVALTDAAFEQAYESLKKYLSLIAASQDVDVISVQWLPGSITAGSPDKFSSLLGRLRNDCPGKQIIMSTGYSTAFNAPADQKQFYLTAFSNLADFRANDASTSTFLGVIFNEACNQGGTEPQAPSQDTATQMASWDRAAKSDELMAMWQGKSPSADMDWWLKKTQMGFGIFSSKAEGDQPTLAPQPAQEALAQIASAVTEANTAQAASTDTSSGSTASTAPPTDTGTGSTTAPAASSSSPTFTVTSPGGQSFGSAVKGKVQEGLLGLLDKVFQKIGDKVMAAGTGSTGYSGTGYPSGSSSSWASTSTTSSSSAWSTTAAFIPAGTITLTGISVTPVSPQAGSPATCAVTLQNASTGVQAQGLTVALVDTQGYLLDPGSQQTGLSVGPGASQPVSINWTPAAPGAVSALVELYDAQLAKLASSPLSITVGGTGTGGGATTPPPSGGAAGIQCAASDVTIAPAGPTVGSPASFTAKLHNSGSAAASGVDLLLVDVDAASADALLAETNGNTIGAGADQMVSVSWTPKAEKTYNLSVQAWKGYEGMLVEAKLPPVVVSAAPAGGGGSPTPPGVFSISGVSVTPTQPGVGDSAQVKVDMSNGSSAAASTLDIYLVDPLSPSDALATGTVPNVAAGASGSVLLNWLADKQGSRALEVQVWDPSALLGSKSVNVTVAAAGSGSGGGTGSGGSKAGPSKFKRVGTLFPDKLPPLPVVKPEITGSSIAAGLPLLKGLEFGGSGMKPMSGQTTMSFSLDNPYELPISDLSVALSIDGKQVQTKSLGVLLAKQSRTVTFSGLSLPGTGAHTCSLKMTGGTGGKLTGTVDAAFSISTRMANEVAGIGAKSARPSIVPLLSGVRAVVPPTFKIGGQVLAARPPMRSELLATIPKIAPTVPTAASSTTSRTTTTLSKTAPTVKPKIAVRPTIPGVSTTTASSSSSTTTTIPGVSPTISKTTTTTATVARPTIPGVISPTTKLPTTTATTTRPTISTATTSPTITSTINPTIPGVTRPTTATTTPTITPTVPITPTVQPTITATTAATLSKITPTVPTVTSTTTAPTATTATTAPTLSTVRPTTGTILPRTTATALVTQADVSIAQADIVCTPLAPKPGDAIVVKLTVRNLSRVAAKSVSVGCCILSDGARGAQRAFTVDVPASGSVPLEWPTTAPNARQMGIDVTLSYAQDPATANNRASRGVTLSSR